jgi:uncharacterized protein YuzE
MKLAYYPETDSLYIELRAKSGHEVSQVAEDILVDLDEAGNPVGVDIQHASRQISTKALEDLLNSLKKGPLANPA